MIRKVFASNILKGAVLAAAGMMVAGFAQAETLRLSTLMKPGSAGVIAAEHMASEINKRTNGRVQIDVYPASQLGDWTEVHELVSQGAVDMAIQPLSTSFDKRLAISWFPYSVTTYESAEKAMTKGGYIDAMVDDIISDQDMKLLGVFGDGMGGAGFVKAVPDASNPDTDRDLKIRIWPGGTTHRHMMERLGFSTVTVPWAELYTGMQVGVVDGQIGGTPQLLIDNFKDITKTWVQYNDHFEAAWIFINKNSFDGLSPEDQQALVDISQEVTHARFAEVKAADEKFLQEMRDAGIDVVTFSDAELEKLASVVRQDVWPTIADEIGADTLDVLRKNVGMN
ncbi:TRAP transporter substrate-binding protein DctP [Thalassospira australica]|uniref:TRAP transporter substrate-binding protein DctP n=1 Tax=Thalassospira australica TaxID=1528106 RepID=UPI00384D85BE